ncbi:tektin-2-like [Pollicipes pollicipes]|uniref:tektin-2-like n=1 Tax=Pollicipes pollicipes TaxID=41117 RepID=UPI001884ECD4|nr:tektin-2-like [Pollicipes pollicipes]
MAELQHKPTTRYRVADWHRHNAQLGETTRAEVDTSLELRQRAGRAANEAAIRTVWEQHQNSGLLRDRLSQVEQWKVQLEQAVAAVDAEVAALSRAKTVTEDEREARHFDLETAQEALAQREGRLRQDVVRDDVEEALKQEILAVTGFRDQLRERCEQCFEQLCRLSEARQALLDDIAGKQGALHVDSAALALTPHSPGVSFKPHCSRVPKDTLTVPRWEDASRASLAAADHQLQQSRQLRAAAVDTAARGRTELASRHATVQFAARRRLHELRQAHDDLAWQHKQVEQEMAETEREIRCLEAAVRDKDPYRKLAETRLEWRMERPAGEGVFDPPWSGLRAEATNVQVKATSLRVERLCADTHTRSRPPPLPGDRSHLDKVGTGQVQATAEGEP